mgnify:CR=1 FL=1
MGRRRKKRRKCDPDKDSPILEEVRSMLRELQDHVTELSSRIYEKLAEITCDETARELWNIIEKLKKIGEDLGMETWIMIDGDYLRMLTKYTECEEDEETIYHI